MQIKVFVFDALNEIKIQIVQETSIEQNIEKVIEKNIIPESDKIKFSFKSPWTANLFENIMDNILIKNDSEITNNDIFNIRGTGYKIIISPSHWIDDEASSIERVINAEKYIVMIYINTVYILTIYDFCLVYNNLYKPTDKINIKNDCVFLDKNRNFLYGNLENEFTKNENYNLILEFVTSSDNTKFIDIFNIINMLYLLDKNNLIKFKFFEQFLEISKKYSFLSESIIFDELSYKNPDIWKNIFKLENNEIVKRLQTDYIKKYRRCEYLLVGGFIKNKKNDDKYKYKYLKYKHKYLQLKNQS
jgi:hypothetical protein